MKNSLFAMTAIILVAMSQTSVYAVPTSFNVQDDLSYLENQSVYPHSNPGKEQSYIDFTLLRGSALFKNDHVLKDLPPLPSLNPEQAREEAKRIAFLLKKSVPHAIFYNEMQKQRWIDLAQSQMEKSGPVLKRPQILVVVDRNPKVQSLCFVLAFPKGMGEWVALGGEKVSTGNRGRKLYYITPTGVFTNTTERIGYRALGTKNKNGIRGNGAKGMRVWDFGWQWAEKGWLPNHEKGQIRLEMHATDPDYLERRLGNPASEGCVRISAAMNKFIDHYGLIDVLYNQAAVNDKRFRSILSNTRESTPIAGAMLVVVDSKNYNDAS